jgi:hypothetical protein
MSTVNRKCKVFNMHPHGQTHVENFRGDRIEIPASTFIVMDYEDAVQFKSQYWPMKIDAMDQPDPASFKCIKLEPIIEDVVPEGYVLNENKELVVEKTIYISHIDGKRFNSPEELDAYINANFKDKIIVDAIAEKEMENKKRGK